MATTLRKTRILARADPVRALHVHHQGAQHKPAAERAAVSYRADGRARHLVPRQAMFARSFMRFSRMRCPRGRRSRRCAASVLRRARSFVRPVGWEVSASCLLSQISSAAAVGCVRAAT